MRALAALLLVVVVAGCTTVAQTPAQRLFATQGEFNIALRAATAYTSQPPCSAVILIGCHKPEVKAGIVSAADDANGALIAAKAALATPQASSRVALAGVATKALLNYMISRGILK